jgi:flagellum-specific ATP synthase
MNLQGWLQARLPVCFRGCDGWVRTGRVSSVGDATVTVRLRGISPGALVAVSTRANGTLFVSAQRVREREADCAPVESVQGIAVGDPASAIGAELGSFCGWGLLGRDVDAWGGPTHPDVFVAPGAPRVPLHRRRPIERSLRTGINAIDALCTLGIGQRVALFAGAGVGKSTLLRLIARHAGLDAHVVALIGERGREAAETIADLRAAPSWSATTVICAPADSPPHERLAAANTALAQAEWLCERGQDVLLTVDSLTRVANAWREIAIAAGEPPAHRGHPPSLVTTLASIVERAGVRHRGSISAIFAVLVDADDQFEPVTDVVRGLLDGHIALARQLADAGRFPPIDVLRSSSRLMQRLVTPERFAQAALVRRALAALERAEDLFAVGAYAPGGDPLLDAAVTHRARLEHFIHQGERLDADPAGELEQLASLLGST